MHLEKDTVGDFIFWAKYFESTYELHQKEKVYLAPLSQIIQELYANTAVGRTLIDWDGESDSADGILAEVHEAIVAKLAELGEPA